jgi:glycerophosphoryl diester phosphodiesterase
LDKWLASRPIAHRGLFDERAGRPENSLAAFRHAASLGVPFEFDVQLTADGVPVVVHDRDLARMTGWGGTARELDDARLRTLRLGSSDEPIPTLEQVLADIDGRVPIIVDVRRWGSSLRGDGLEQAVARLLRDYPHPAALQSFDPLAVLRLRRLVQDRPVGQVSGELRSVGPVLRALGRLMATNVLTHPDFITYDLARLPSAAVDFWRRAGRPLLAYTAHSPIDERQAAAVADNFFFSGYLPAMYTQPEPGQPRSVGEEAR